MSAAFFKVMDFIIIVVSVFKPSEAYVFCPRPLISFILPLTILPDSLSL